LLFSIKITASKANIIIPVFYHNKQSFVVAVLDHYDSWKYMAKRDLIMLLVNSISYAGISKCGYPFMQN
jgi:hypothetical protein